MDELKTLLRKDDPFLHATRIGSHNFPGIWSAMMPSEIFGLRVPEEKRATCMNCPKAAYEQFRPDYRCCTYHPRVANFLLGLATETPVGDRVVTGLLERGMLLPEGMHYAPSQWFDYLSDLQNEDFGRSVKVLCPMLDRSTGFCNIHAFRNAVCSTFFCYKDHGDAGDEFWDKVQVLGSQLEMGLGQWALREVGFDLTRYFKSFDKLAKNMLKLSTEDGWQKEALAELWGSWQGRERELMRACAAVVVRERENLWQIADSQAIHESRLFDRAMVKAVPKHLEDQIDPEDLDEDSGDTMRPTELWHDCLKAYWKLWTWPEGEHRLSEKAQVVRNTLSSPEELYRQDQPYFIEYRARKNSKGYTWRLPLSEPQLAVLKLFEGTPRALDASLIVEPAMRQLSKAKDFISEMLRQKVLVES